MVVGAGDGGPWGCRRAGEGHVTGGEVGDRLAEDDGEVDGPALVGSAWPAAWSMVTVGRPVSAVGLMGTATIAQRAAVPVVQLMVTEVPVACLVLAAPMTLKLLSTA